MKPKQLNDIYKAITQSASLRGIDPDSFSCTYRNGWVEVVCSSIEDATKFVTTFQAVGMKVEQTGAFFKVRYPTASERNRMQ